MATKTANGLYSFDAIFCERSLAYWIEQAHMEMSKKSGWKYMPLCPGTFGYDNHASSIAYAFLNYIDGMNREEISSLIHDGWVQNYVFWRDHKPWKTNKNYKAPSKALGDARRNLCATQSYSDLPDDEKQKDLIIADYILSQLQ